ncbi:MAG: alpha-galactosidase [Erysipelotrichaceae bacterium]|nr:alpha-galactosidase [Erysipelotrichaceae bacterium]
MGIVYNEKAKEFHLFNNEISYIIKVLENGHLGHLYYGKRIKHREDFSHLLEIRRRAMAVFYYEGSSFSLEHIKQEYPSYGAGDMRYPAYEILQENGSRITEFKYRSHNIFKGKKKLEGLPATYVESDEEATTSEITVYDEVIKTEIVLSYTIYEELPVITRNAKFKSFYEEKLVLMNAMSLCVDLPDAKYEMIELTGGWSRERHIKTRKLEHGISSIYSMKGTCSSSNYNPFIALKRPNTDEYAGEVYGFSLVYSGNFLAQVEVDTHEVARVTMGINPHNFNWTLKNGEEFQTPEVVTVYSDQGLNKMSQSYHKLYRTRLARGYWRDKVRPILVNNWEATYFDFDEDKIVNLGKKAKELGIELLVLDDGWFGARNDDTKGLGDWYPNLNKIPSGIADLSRKVEELGLSFGLWIEPEMINLDSDLYREHPEYVLRTPNRHLSNGRNQYVLDFSKDEVVEYIYKMLEKVISESKISYIKWDMNRCMSEAFSQGNDSEHQGKLMHKYILGVYKLYDKLTTQFPEILFESCASGGARFDPGMLYYAPQTWASDNSDAIERLKIQYGTSMVYPLSSIGAHVSAIPNHQVYRNTPIETRANVAYFGTFGYELDLNKLSDEEQEKVKDQIQFMKEYREVIQKGTFYRLTSPFEEKYTVWQVVSEDKKTSLVGFYRPLQEVNTSYKRVKLCGLHAEAEYEVSINNTVNYGDELMNLGLSISDLSSGEFTEKYDGTNGDYHSRIYVIKQK